VDTALVLGGGGVASLVAIGTNVSALGIAFGMFAMTPRYLAALGRPDAFGSWIAREDRRHVPQRALWLTAAAVMVLSLSGRLMELFALSSVAVMAQYAVSVGALAVLSLRRLRGLRLAHAWPAPFALAAIALIGSAARAPELGVAAAVLVLGALLLWGRRRMAHRAKR
jgi:amino acid transporter